MATLKKAVELSPRNEQYLFNLANVYMVNRRVDDAIAIFRSLAGNSDPNVALQSNQALAQATSFRDRAKTSEIRLENRTEPETQQLPSAGNSGMDQAVTPTSHVSPTRVHFLKGKLVSADCSATPQVLLTVVAGAKSVKLHVSDSAHMILLGADAFPATGREKMLR